MWNWTYPPRAVRHNTAAASPSAAAQSPSPPVTRHLHLHRRPRRLQRSPHNRIRIRSTFGCRTWLRPFTTAPAPRHMTRDGPAQDLHASQRLERCGTRGRGDAGTTAPYPPGAPRGALRDDILRPAATRPPRPDPRRPDPTNRAAPIRADPDVQIAPAVIANPRWSLTSGVSRPTFRSPAAAPLTATPMVTTPMVTTQPLTTPPASTQPASTRPMTAPMTTAVRFATWPHRDRHGW